MALTFLSTPEQAGGEEKERPNQREQSVHYHGDQPERQRYQPNHRQKYQRQQRQRPGKREQDAPRDEQNQEFHGSRADLRSLI
jgi:hypothetical protein